MGAVGATFTGFRKNAVSGRLDIYYRGALVGTANASSFGASGAVTSGALSSTTTITSGTSILATTSIEATTTLVAGTGLTITSGDHTNTAGDSRVTAGNLRLGAVSTFANTQPTSAVVMKAGTAPVGAITTSCAVYIKESDGSVIEKLIADGTASNVES